MDGVAGHSTGRTGGNPLDAMVPLPPSYFICRSLGLAYLQIPKAGCSSFKAMILAAEDPDRFRQLWSDIETSVWKLHHDAHLFETSSDAGTLLRFTFVRHPFNRVLSFYRNLINPKKDFTPEKIQKRKEDLSRSGFRPGMTFEDCIERIVGSSGPSSDPHVRPQVEYLFHPAGITVDYIGKVEDMGRHEIILRAVTGRPGLVIPHLNQTGGGDWTRDPRFTPGIVAALKAHYLADLTLLGYVG